jgi:hypothetical protein
VPNAAAFRLRSSAMPSHCRPDATSMARSWSRCNGAPGPLGEAHVDPGVSCTPASTLRTSDRPQVGPTPHREKGDEVVRGVSSAFGQARYPRVRQRGANQFRLPGEPALHATIAICGTASEACPNE